MNSKEVAKLKGQSASDMMFLMSYVYDDLKSRRTRLAKDPMLMVGQVWSILHKRGFRVIDISALEATQHEGVKEE